MQTMTSAETVSAPIHTEASGSGTRNTSLVEAQEAGNSNEENAGDRVPEVEEGNKTETGLEYIASFRSRQHLMPHWRNIFAKPRNDWCGSATVLSFSPRGRGLVLGPSQELLGSTIDPSSLAHALGSVRSRSVLPPAVLVSDLSEALINSIGSTLHLSPEVFEAHLVQSGYMARSYEDRYSSNWSTRFLPKQHVSLRWYSLVLRKDIEPRDASSRDLLLENNLVWHRSYPVRGGIGLDWHRRYLRTLTNIFRREWSLSSVYRPLKRILVHKDPHGLVDVGEADEMEEVDKLDHRPDEELDIVAWEERVTFCLGSYDQARLPVLFFDPLPRLQLSNDARYDDDIKSIDLMPFSQRLAPRGPPPVQQFDDDLTTLDAVSAYATSTNDARSDVAAWIDHLAKELVTSTAIDLLLLAVLKVVQQDTVVLLEHINEVLDQISTGSMDDSMMQEQLGHWRTVLSRLQSELPALEKSMGEFFAFPYVNSDHDGDPERPHPVVLRELQAVTISMTERCHRVQESLRAEMSLLESKRGIEEAESVSRLTELGFIFIPITLATSFFSMQVRELANDPPPLYVFVMTAVVAVTISYGLRLVQRSTSVSEVARKWGDKIRRDEQVTTRVIPTRKVAKWLCSEFGLMALIFIVSSGFFILFIVPLWTRASMDTSVKGAMTGLMICFSLLVVGLLIRINSTGDGSFLPDRGNDVFGFGRIWRAPPRSQDRSSTYASNLTGGGQQGPSSDNHV